MNKLIASAGVLALGGVFSVQAQDKNWSLSGTIRTFYDDNYTTSPSHPAPGFAGRRNSYGFELNPSASYNVTMDQATISLGYKYDMKYYEDRRQNSADHSHEANLALNYRFSEICQLKLSDNFAVAQEPGVLDPALVTTPLRSNGNNIRNAANINLSGYLTRLFDYEVGYSNTYYDYQQTGTDSRSALLDRVEHLMLLNLKWKIQPETTGIFGYSFGIVDQTSKDLITIPPPVLPSTRDNYSHYAYAGVDHSMSTQWHLGLRAGLQYTEFPNAPAPLSKSSVTPYLDANTSYEYAPGSRATLGVKHTRNQTDVATLDAESTTVYTTVTHQFTPLLVGNLIAQYQNSSFYQGPNNNKSDNLFLVGVQVEYELPKVVPFQWWAQAGYNYDRLDSDLSGRSYYRNRIYIGLRATY